MSVSSDSTPSCRRGGRSMRPDSVFKRSLALVRSRLAPPLSRRSPSRPRNFLWPMLVVAYVIAVGAGTVFPWPIAASRLAGVGNGPYVPLTYTSLSSDTREYRSQIYLVPSRTAESLELVPCFRGQQNGERGRDSAGCSLCSLYRSGGCRFHTRQPSPTRVNSATCELTTHSWQDQPQAHNPQEHLGSG